MNFAGYFLLAASAVLVVVTAQQSADFDLSKRERDTIEIIEQSSKLTSDLTQAFMNGTKRVSKAAEIILNGISSMEQLQNPEDAKKFLLQAFDNGRNELFKSGVDFLESIGRAFGLSTDAARQGFDAAIKSIMRSGLSTLDAINIAETLCNRGIGAGKIANGILFEACGSAVKTGFVGSYDGIQESIQKVIEGLTYAQLTKLAQNQSMIRRAQYQNYCEAGEKDRMGSEAIRGFNEGAKTALRLGAKFEFVQSLLQHLKCSIADFLMYQTQLKLSRENIKILEPSDAEMKFAKDSNDFKEGIADIATRMILELGNLAAKSGYQQNNDISAAILTLEEAVNAKIFLAREISKQILAIGYRRRGDVPSVANLAAAKLEDFGKAAFMEGLARIGELVFKFLTGGNA